MRFNEAIKAIKERISLVDLARRYVDVKPNGSRFTAPCPFHQETKPSFSINAERGLFYCFGCHASGDLIDFYAKINGLDTYESVCQLAQETGITIDAPGGGKKHAEAKNTGTARQAMLRMHELAARHFASALATSPECSAYIQKRGLSQEITDRFELGWAKRDWHSLAETLRKGAFDLNLACQCGLLGKSSGGSLYDRFRGRLMFPIKNLSSQIIAFGGRIIADEDEAKYINSADTPIYSKKEHLYGLAQARKGIAAKGFAILTEGYMDVLTLHQFGYDNSVGVLGTALTGEQIKRLCGFTSKMLLVFDGDRAGRKAALRSSEMLLARGVSCKVVILPEEEDIDSLLRGKGPGAFDALRAKAQDGLEFCADTLRALAPREAVEWARNFLGGIQISELARPYASILAQRLHIDENMLRQEAAAKEAASGRRRADQPAMLELRNVRDEQILIFAVRYPDRLEDLRALGADMALSSPGARLFWEIIEKWGPEEAVYHLDEQQKKFWFKQRGPGAAPLDNADLELSFLERELEKFYRTTQKESLNAALADNSRAGDFASDLEYLRALQETIGAGHEQS